MNCSCSPLSGPTLMDNPIKPFFHVAKFTTSVRCLSYQIIDEIPRTASFREIADPKEPVTIAITAIGSDAFNKMKLYLATPRAAEYRRS